MDTDQTACIYIYIHTNINKSLQISIATGSKTIEYKNNHLDNSRPTFTAAILTQRYQRHGHRYQR
jgi:hypothetical protein